MMKVYYWYKKSRAIMIADKIVAETSAYIWFEWVGSLEITCIRKADLITIEYE